MAMFGPEHLVVMREALSHFYDEIGNFRMHQGFDPAPGSAASAEQATSPRPQSLVTARSISALLIESAGEHVTAFVKTITEPIEPIACWTCVRSMLESCSLAAWLLDPRIDARTRIGRVFAVRHEGMEQQLKCIRAEGNSDTDIKKRIDKVEQDALLLGYPRISNSKGKRLGIGQHMPSTTDIIGLMLDKEIVYRILSAVAHGHSWAIRQLGFQPVPEGANKVGGVPVTMFEKTVEIDKLAWLGLTAATAFAKPVWHECQYFGWDKEQLIALFDSIFDQLQTSQDVRFWHDA